MQKKLSPDDYTWDTSNQLLAAIVDLLNIQLWAKTKDGQKNRNRPKPIERPGFRPKVYGRGRGMTIDQAQKWVLDRQRLN